MTGWTPADPGAGDLDGLLDRMATLAGVRDHAEAIYLTVRHTTMQVPDVWTGDDADAWRGDTDAAAASWSSLHTWAACEFRALGDYVTAVESIAERARRPQTLFLEATAQLSGHAEGSDGARPYRELLRASDAASRDLATLAAERHVADERLMATLRRFHDEV
ncbi:hypothetical protein AX769_11140 [Frondihabitans sp. PAMC 28766]|uniref:hypothetical protein n=1 Tax=Frondihabitans sp. PAMC 28766 TaxID=1795630 RepID=UPI00078C4EDB|nr:hypothetical protein [Frondihabitans sp. PAMC 28766]AMM20592.1 hypothetical protein AX769_11140 [Frondihabitans sp. PAMC 28766]